MRKNHFLKKQTKVQQTAYTINPQKQHTSSNFYKDKNISLNIPRQNIKLWRETSTSLTRDSSPSYKIPKQIRFKSIQEQSLKVNNILPLNLRSQIKHKNGAKFPKSSRPQHFIKCKQYPSPADYNPIRFLQDISIYPSVSSNLKPQQIQLKKLNSYKPGISIPKFTAYNKLYVEHSKHKVYQPQDVLYVPGPDHYFRQTFDTKIKSFKITRRKLYDSRQIQIDKNEPKSERLQNKQHSNSINDKKYHISNFLEQYC